MSSAIDTDNVTVSLSRLALAKAIKTPDDGESEAEPWTKSVIFHQSHVSENMRQSMLFPNQPRHSQQQRMHHARPHSQMLRHDPHHPAQQQQQQARPMSQYPQQRRRSRSSSHLLDYQQHPPQQQQQQHHQYQHQQYAAQQQLQHSRGPSPQQQQMLHHGRPRSSYEMYESSPQPSDRSASQGSSSHRASSSQERATPPPTASARRKTIVASDDEDDDDDDEVDEEEGEKSSDEESQPTPMPRKSASFQILNNSKPTPTPTPSARPNVQQLSDHEDESTQEPVEQKHEEKNRSRRNLHGQTASDSEDEDEDEEDDNTDDEDEEDADNDDRIITQNFSDMPMTATARRPSSTMLDDDALNARRMSTLRQLERGPSMHKRSRSQGDMNLMTEQAEVQAAIIQNPYAETTGKSGAIERWRQGITDGTPTSSRPSSAQGLPNPNDDGEMEEEEEDGAMPSSASRSSFVPSGYRRSRRSTIGEMDMMYYHMQQQQQMQWQMQQAAQMQQMAQIQQYQQFQQQQAAAAAMMMQQQQQQQQALAPPPPANLNPNRKSVSAMDLLTQLEKEKEESRRKPYNPKTRVNAPNGATIDSGLLGRLPAKQSHNLSFQQLQQGVGTDHQHKMMMRASRSDMNLSSMGVAASRSDMNLSAMGGGGGHQRRSRSPGPEKALRSASALDVSNMGKKNGGGGGSGGRISNTDARRRSEMIRSESAPMVAPSMSTPINNRQSFMPPGAAGPSNQMYGQYLMPMTGGAPMQMPGMMTQSMSSGNRSAPMNSSNRRSMANWSNNSTSYR